MNSNEYSDRLIARDFGYDCDYGNDYDYACSRYSFLKNVGLITWVTKYFHLIWNIPIFTISSVKISDQLKYGIINI